jgi:hypothetical protein
MRVLVCGGRDFDDVGLMISALDRLHTEKFFTVLIHGNARGADRMADAWAWCRGVPREPYEVPQGEWDELGKKAGPLRNQRMLDEGKPDLVVAFPGAGGTKDMVRRAVKAGVPVHEVNRADDTERHLERRLECVRRHTGRPCARSNYRCGDESDL